MLKDDIKAGANLLSSTSKNGTFYFNTNEFIEEYIKYFKIKNANVLTVLASGDQALFSILNGAKNIDAFDSNQMCKYLFDLKCAAIKTLDNEEYQSFIPVTNEIKTTYFSKEKYKKVREALNDNSKKFWDALYFNNLEDNYFKLRKSSFTTHIIGKEYFSEENYQKLQTNINNCNIRIYNANLFSLPVELTKTRNYYDTIFLSNIFDYTKLKEEEFLNFLDKTIKPTMNDEGKILAYYMFNKYATYFEKAELKIIYGNNTKPQAKIRIIKK